MILGIWLGFLTISNRLNKDIEFFFTINIYGFYKTHGGPSLAPLISVAAAKPLWHPTLSKNQNRYIGGLICMFAFCCQSVSVRRLLWMLKWRTHSLTKPTVDWDWGRLLNLSLKTCASLLQQSRVTSSFSFIFTISNFWSPIALSIWPQIWLLQSTNMAKFSLYPLPLPLQQRKNIPVTTRAGFGIRYTFDNSGGRGRSKEGRWDDRPPWADLKNGKETPLAGARQLRL